MRMKHGAKLWWENRVGANKIPPRDLKLKIFTLFA